MKLAFAGAAFKIHSPVCMTLREFVSTHEWFYVSVFRCCSRTKKELRCLRSINMWRVSHMLPFRSLWFNFSKCELAFYLLTAHFSLLRPLVLLFCIWMCETNRMLFYVILTHATQFKFQWIFAWKCTCNPRLLYRFRNIKRRTCKITTTTAAEKWENCCHR